MEGLGFFHGATSFRAPESPWPESDARYMAGSSSSSSVGRTHIDESLESAFSRLKVSPFSPPPQLQGFVGGYNGFSGGESSVPVAFWEGGLQRNSGFLSHLGLDDCFIDSDLVGNRTSGIGSHWSPENLAAAELRGKVMSLAKDEQGCRILQDLLMEPRKELVDLIFLEIIDDLAPLILDHHGSYVVQKLVEVCTEEQRTHMLLKLTKKNDLQLLCIALNTRGSRTIQKLLKYVTNEQQVRLLVGALGPCVVELSKNLNGQHVIEHCLHNLSYDDNEGLLRVVANNCLSIAKDKCGCCVLQKCVEYSKGETRVHLFDAITENAIVLAGDRYGNYVLQHLLGLKIRWVTTKLLIQLQGSYIVLSCNKYGSNVVEKCLSESREEQSSQIIFELLTNPNVSMLLLHQYGNYVIQTALAVSKGFSHVALLNLVEKNYYTMLHNPYGKRILRSLNRI